MTREDMEKILKNAGWTAADIRFTAELGEASLSEDEFKAFVREGFEATQRAEKSSRWKALRKDTHHAASSAMIAAVTAWHRATSANSA
jgi:hypothetical protein